MKYTYPRPRPNMEAGQLGAQIQETLGQDTLIKITPKTVSIWFKEPLTEADEQTLGMLVEAHVEQPWPEPKIDGEPKKWWQFWKR